MDHHLKQDALIEDALRSQPLAPMPRSITVDVMAAIQKGTRPAILTWSDLVLSLVIAACIAALWFAAQHLPPIMLVKLRIQGILLYQDFLVNARWLIPTAMVVVAAFVTALSIPALFRTTMNNRR